MFEIHSQEKEIEEKLKKMGYINWKKNFKVKFLICYWKKE
jgi:hypothetical protein